MKLIRRLTRVLLGGMILLFFLVYSLGLLHVPLLDTLENTAYDMRLRATMPATLQPDIVIVDVDERSLNTLGRWPWGRDVLARLVDGLFNHYNVRVLGFDMFFAEADHSSGLPVLEALAERELRHDPMYLQTLNELRPDLAYDERFANSLRSRPVVLGFVFDQGNASRVHALPKPVAQIDESYHDSLSLAKPMGYTANLPVLQQQAVSAGFFDNPSVDDDGKYRRVPVLQMFDGGLYPSMALEVSRLALGAPPLSIGLGSYGQDQYVVEAVHLGDQRIPVDDNGNVLVPYRGEQGSFPYVSAIDVLEQRVPVSELKNSIVLLGTSAPGLLDLRSTPVQNIYPGVEVNANIIDGVLSNRIKRQPAYVMGATFILLLTIGVAMMVCMPLLSPVGNILFACMLALGTLWLNLTLWHNGLVVPLASSLSLVLMLFLLQMTYGFLIETRSKRVLARLFGQYVPPELVDEMSRNPDAVSMEGQDKEMSVLFSDVRDFTSISETLESKELAYLMNEYLTPMSRVIHQHRGTIDKYMGDAIMAFWGAPLDDPEHARKALYAGLDMLKTVAQLQDEFARRGWPPIRIGIGINTGNMSVGNMGSDFRMAYTVMGDEVNLGSRIESLTKLYGVELMVSESTRQAVPEFVYRELDRVKVKGKEQAVTIYEPVGLREALSAQEISDVERFNEAVTLYRARQWQRATDIIQSLQKDAIVPKVVYDMYLERITYHQANPPDAEWDGVVAYSTK